METIQFQLWRDEEKKIVNPELFSNVAENLAKKFNEEGGKNKNKRTQLRKFYDEISEYKNRLKSRNERERIEEFEYTLPYLNMLIAKVVYAEGRNLVSNSFKEFIIHGVKNIKTPDDLFVFADLFEAVMGFYRIYE